MRGGGRLDWTGRTRAEPAASGAEISSATASSTAAEQVTASLPPVAILPSA